MTLYIHSFQEVIEEIQFQCQSGETVRQCLQRFFFEMDVQQDLCFEPHVDRVIIVDFKQQTKRIAPDLFVSDLLDQRGELSLMIVYPSEPKGALIEFIVNDDQCYFENLINKSELIEKYINSLLKKVGIQNNVEIKINGKLSTPESEPEKKSIKWLIAYGNSQKITVEINQRNKAKNVSIKNKKQQDSKKKVQINGSSPQKEDKNGKVKNQNKIEVAGGEALRGEHRMKKKEDKENLLIEGDYQKAKQEFFHFSIFFQAGSTQRSLSIDVLPSQTMIDVLPNFLKVMAEAGFDWEPGWKDYRDRLSIVYRSTQFNKFDKKFKSILTEEQKGQPFQFTIKRRYQGG